MIAPKPHDKPTAKRLPKGKLMTICIGIRSQEGIVIAADAQETDGYSKRAQQKIFTWGGLQAGSAGPSHLPVGCVITGAGDAGFIDSFYQKLMGKLRLDLTASEFEEILTNEIKEFYLEHVLPARHVEPDADLRMLVGIYFGFRTGLYLTYKSTVQNSLAYSAIGIGAESALQILAEMPLIRSLRETEVIAAYIIWRIKESSLHCGKYTDIVSIRSPVMTDETPARLVHPPLIVQRVPGRDIARWEGRFGEHWLPAQANLLKNLISEQIQEDETERTTLSIHET